jgi:D-mannonate dehydratase
MNRIADNSSPKNFWGQKFMHSVSKKYFYIAAWQENINNMRDSSVTLVDVNGMLVVKAMRWDLFWTTYVPSLDDKNIFESKNIESAK